MWSQVKLFHRGPGAPQRGRFGGWIGDRNPWLKFALQIAVQIACQPLQVAEFVIIVSLYELSNDLSDVASPTPYNFHSPS